LYEGVPQKQHPVVARPDRQYLQRRKPPLLGGRRMSQRPRRADRWHANTRR
jgi:hypothetical protein